MYEAIYTTLQYPYNLPINCNYNKPSQSSIFCLLTMLVKDVSKFSTIFKYMKNDANFRMISSFQLKQIILGLLLKYHHIAIINVTSN